MGGGGGGGGGGRERERGGGGGGRERERERERERGGGGEYTTINSKVQTRTLLYGAECTQVSLKECLVVNLTMDSEWG